MPEWTCFWLETVCQQSPPRVGEQIHEEGEIDFTIPSEGEVTHHMSASVQELSHIIEPRSDSRTAVGKAFLPDGLAVFF